MKKYVSFDVEIARVIPPGGDWLDHRPVGITCAATWVTGESEPTLWYGGMDQHKPTEPQMRVFEVNGLLAYLVRLAEQGIFPLTWNGARFDFRVLHDETSNSRTAKALALVHYDMMFQFFCIKGYMLGLDAAAKGAGLSGKPEGMKGNMAPLLWLENPAELAVAGHMDLAELSLLERRRMVLDYLIQDVATTKDLAGLIEFRGKVEWISQSGKLNDCRFPGGLKMVAESFFLPKPDTSWMNDPVSRRHFVDWLGIYETKV